MNPLDALRPARRQAALQAMLASTGERRWKARAILLVQVTWFAWNLALTLELARLVARFGP